MSRPDAKAEVQIDNEVVKVTRWCFPPGGETGWHRHEFNYVVVPLSTGTLLLETSKGDTSSELSHGVSYYRNKGAEHNVINSNDFEFSFVEIEFKKAD
ncbi:MAG TPA: cupin domain-containing protein [Salinisphaeraceae bacterium]|nr:cupin domain-containing protein [Salinisphaeraceae bacterium]